MSNECPFRKSVNIVERNEKEKEIFYETDGDEEEEYEADDGHTYVVRQMMLARKNESQTQLYQLFQTRCTINDKVFRVIIDSGYCENIIRMEIVRMLDLSVKEYPNPCTLGQTKVAIEKIEAIEC